MQIIVERIHQAFVVMLFTPFPLLFALTLLASCLHTKPTKTASTDKDYPIKLDTLTFHDTLRNRNIPIAFYQPATDERIESNGGDMTVLFAHKYPALAHKIISLDNRRMPLPRVSNPIIYTLRSNDYPADEGVLPTEVEQETYGITVQFVPINHSSMDDDATPEEREIMNTYILEYLQNK